MRVFIRLIVCVPTLTGVALALNAAAPPPREPAPGVCYKQSAIVDLLRCQPNGTLVATTSDEDARIHLWDHATGKLVRRLTGHERQAAALAFSPTGKQLVSSDYAGEVRLWDVASGKSTLLPGPEFEYAIGVGFAKDGNEVVALFRDGQVYRWHATTHKHLATVEIRLPQELADRMLNTWLLRTQLWTCGDGQFLATHVAREPGKVVFWEMATGKKAGELPMLQGRNRVVAVEIDGKQATVLGKTGDELELAVWTVPGAKLVRRTRIKHDVSRLQSLALDLRRGWAWVGDWDGYVTVLELKTGKPLRRFDAGRERANVKLTPDGKRLLVHCHGPSDTRPTADVNSGSVSVWDAKSGERLRVFEERCRVGRAMRFLDNDKSLLVWSVDGFDLSQMPHVARIDLGKQKITQLARGRVRMAEAAFVSADGERIVEAGGGHDALNRLAAYPAKPGAKTLFANELSSQGVLSLAASEKAGLVATCQEWRSGKVGVIRVWDLKSGKATHKWNEPEEGASSLAFSPDGKLLASGGRRETVVLWDAQTGKAVASLPETVGAGSITCLDFSPDGRLLAGGSASGPLRVWDAGLKKEVAEMGHPDDVVAAVFSPDSTRLVSGCVAGVVICFDARTGKRLWAVAEAHKGGVSAVCHSADGKRVATAGLDGTVRVWDAKKGTLIDAFEP